MSWISSDRLLVFTALLTAVGRDPVNPLITQADIVAGCKKQMRGALQMLDFEQRLVPEAGLDDLIVTDPVRDHLQAMVRIEKARSMLFGPCAFKSICRRKIDLKLT